MKYLGVILHEHLEWQGYINSLLIKLNRAAGLLSKIRHYVPKFLLRAIYFSIFNSYLIYTCQIWGQKENTIKKLSEIQDKAIHIISFKDKNYPTNELYYNNKILKIADYIKLLNCLFVKRILSNNHTVAHKCHGKRKKLPYTCGPQVSRQNQIATAKQKSYGKIKSHGKAKTTTKLKSHGKMKKLRQNKKATAK